MKYFRYILLFLLAFAMILPAFSVSAAELPESKNWLFIDGVNVTRQIEYAVVYRNTDRTGQNRWGYDVIVDAENKVTQIVKSGEAEEGGSVIPKGGWVVSASGSKIKWLEDNVSVGDTLYFDNYTQRLFVCDSNGSITPFETKTFDIQEFGNGFMLAEPENSDFKVDFVYAVTLDGKGRIIACGQQTEIPEGGSVIYATTLAARQNLIAYAPLGGICKIEGSKATFSYTKNDLKKSLELALAQATGAKEKALAEFADVNYDLLDSLINEATELTKTVLNYKSVFTMMYRLRQEVGFILNEGKAIELRGAFHTPVETTNEEVKKTILAAKRSGLNTLILRVSNGYGTCASLPADNKFAQDEIFNNFDVLKSFSKNCKDEGLSLVLCFDVYYNEFASIASPSWVSETNSSEGDIAEKYFSPENQEFKEYYLDYIKYVITNYDVDSVMFDSLRYPKFNEKSDLGYDDRTMNSFAEKYNIPINEVKEIKTKLYNSDHWQKWAEFRMSLVSDMAVSISETVRGARSDVNLFFVAERDTLNYYYCQDSMKWIGDKLFDGAMVAVYDRDEDEKDSIGANAYYDNIISEKLGVFPAFTGDDNFFFAGLESSKGIGSELMNSAISDARKVGVNGFIFSSLADFIPHAAEVNLKSSNAISPLNEPRGFIEKILDSAWLRLYNVIYKNEGCDLDSLNLAESRINEAKALAQSGEFTAEHAKELASDMAVIFAAATAKNQALRDFKDLEKMVKLSKTSWVEPEPVPPEESLPESDVSEPSDNAPVSSEATVSEEESSKAASASDANEGKGMDFGEILIYLFVGVAAFAAISALVIGIKRKRSTPSNRHMPKGSAKGYEDKQ